MQKDQTTTGVSLLLALNAASAKLQSSIKNEQAVFAAFHEQVINLKLRGGISLLDASGKILEFKVITYDTPLRRMLTRFEKLLHYHSVGYRIAIHQVDVYEQVITQGSAHFVPDTSQVTAQVVPKVAKNLIGPLLKALGSPPGIFAPIRNGSQVIGMMNIVGPNLTELDIPAVQALANHIGIALENAQLVQNLQETRDELDRAYEATLEGWVQALELRDNLTEGHTLRVAQLTVDFAEKLGFPSEELPHLRRGALLHDIGKMAIPDQILLKPAELDADEWAVMRKHPELALNWLSGIPYLHKSLIIPYCHHEKWDGSGYPRGLMGDQIPMAARIFAVVDVWDALTSSRPYRNRNGKDEAIQYIREQAGGHFDPTIAKKFLEFYSHA
jgi:putative nucleotidyltransferase with HDIG domain